jgi:hypothetical protein
MWSTLATVASPLVALVAAVIAVVVARRSERIYLQQAELDRNLVLIEYFRDLRLWAERVIDAMSELIYLCDLDPTIEGTFDVYALRHDLRQRLSSLGDRGRLMLPNIHDDDVGLDRPSAFRGLKQQALDLVITAHDVANRVDYRRREPNREVREAAVAVKRAFVSEMQEILDARAREQEIRSLRSSGHGWPG